MIFDRIPTEPAEWDRATMGSAVFANIYKGERWRYASNVHNLMTLPWRFLVGSGRNNAMYRFDTYDTWAEIPADLMVEWEIELVRYIPGRDE